ncbi:MAG: MarR family winged helix-turn-helix transcriptional regulator [Gaiellales bacterium]
MAGRMQPESGRHPLWLAWQTFFETHAEVSGRLESELQAEHGLSLRWYDVLLHLHAAADGELTMRELAAAVVISKSGLTGLIDRMQTAGLVLRRPDPQDRRGTRVALTPEGRSRYLQARSTHRRGVAAQFLDHLSAPEAATMTRALRRVRAATGHEP